MVTPEDIRLVETCGACPEQYDAYNGTVIVGYLRLRHGHFSVEAFVPTGDEVAHPGYDREEVYSATPNGDGIFDEDERQGYLDVAKAAIALRLNQVEHLAAERAAGWSGTGIRREEMIDAMVPAFHGDDDSHLADLNPRLAFVAEWQLRKRLGAALDAAMQVRDA